MQNTSAYQHGYESKWGHMHAVCYTCAEGMMTIEYVDKHLCCKCGRHIASGSPRAYTEEINDGVYIRTCKRTALEGPLA